MFQYAAGKALACKHGTSLLLDTSGFNNYYLHQLGLTKLFTNSCVVAKPSDIQQLIGYRARPFAKKILRKLQFKPLNRNLFFEPSDIFWQSFSNLPDNVYLEGYWQSENYFLDFEETIRESFRFPPLIDLLNQGLAEAMVSKSSVSVHIRRGDYVSQTINQSIYYQCTLDYYRAAMAHINAHVANPSYYVFSDDIEWAKTVFADDAIQAFIGHNQGEKSYIDMQLMSLCKHNIIANSTFSWWGAWLNENRAKIVISPREWFINGRSSKDLIPENWIKI